MRLTTPFKNCVILFVALASILAGCGEDEPAGPGGAAQKPFTLVMAGLEGTIAHSLIVSADGTKVLAGVNNSTNPQLYYSKDGGTTFAAVTDVAQNRIKYPMSISNLGLVQTTDKKLFNIDGTEVTSPGGDIIMAGDNGKVFTYHHNEVILKYRNSGETIMQTVTLPVDAKPNYPFNYTAVKAKGKGVVFIASPVARADKSIGAYVLDESTMTWASYSIPVTWSKINNCNNLSMFERFSYGMNNTIIMKGCSGTAILNLAAGTASYLTYPEIANVIPETIRDGNVEVDVKGNIYISAGASYAGINVYVYKNNKWSNLDDYLPNVAALAIDATGNIYYNSRKGEGTIVKTPVKLDVQAGTRKILSLPREKPQINEALVIGNEVIVVTELQMFRYDITANSLKRFDLKGDITDFNVLSDGRWTAGGPDVLYISSDQGATWTETPKVFSSKDPKGAAMSVIHTRIVNGQTLVMGVATSTYYNLSLGVEQTKRSNMIVALDGAAPNYQFPNDFSCSAIGPDGTLYGFAEFVTEFGSTRDQYEIKPNTAPHMLTLKQAPAPIYVADDGLQMTINNADVGYKIHTRKSVEETWTPVGEQLPGEVTNYTALKIRGSGNSITYIAFNAVYRAGD